MKKFLMLGFGIWVLGYPLSASAERGDAGSVTADFLRLGAGAEAAAQGEAYAGRSGDVEAFAYNPAGLRHAPRHEIMLQHNNYLHDLSSEYLAGVYKFRNGWALAGSLTYLDEGRQTRRTISSPTGLGTFSADATVGAIGFSAPLGRHFSLGVTAKIFNDQIDNAERTGAAFDLGLHYLNPSRRFEIGGVVRNLGPEVKFDVAKEALPLEFAVGGSVKVIDRLRLSGEAVSPKNQEMEYRIGADLRLHKFLALRAGYNTRNDAGSGMSFGAGFNYQNINVDYAWVGFDRLGDAHRVGLTVGFGTFEERPAEVSRDPAPVRNEVRIAPPVRPEPRVAHQGNPRWGIVALPFTDLSGEAGNEWIGGATSEVLNTDWRRRGAHNPSMDLVKYVVDGDYRTADGILSLEARISNQFDSGIHNATAVGKVSEPYAVWQSLRLKVNQILAAEGVTGLNLSPATAYFTRNVSPVPPSAERRGISIAVRQSGASSSSTASSELSRAGERALADRGISTDAATNAYRLDAQMTEINGGNAVVYGNIVERSTGIPVAKIEIYGSLSDMPAFGNKIADAVIVKLPRA